MAGERDVLAEAQAFLDEARVLVEPSPEYDDWLVRAPAVIRSLFAATFSALAALSKSAPDRPEPLPREALDVALRAVVADVVWELRHRKPNVSDADIAGVLERAALSPDRPTPP